jgi:hypothetical protein
MGLGWRVEWETQVLRAEYRGPETKCSNTAATEEGSRVRLSESWNPAVAAPNRFSG